MRRLGILLILAGCATSIEDTRSSEVRYQETWTASVVSVARCIQGAIGTMSVLGTGYTTNLLPTEAGYEVVTKMSSVLYSSARVSVDIAEISTDETLITVRWSGMAKSLAEEMVNPCADEVGALNLN